MRIKGFDFGESRRLSLFHVHGMNITGLYGLSHALIDHIEDIDLCYWRCGVVNSNSTVVAWMTARDTRNY